MKVSVTRCNHLSYPMEDGTRWGVFVDGRQLHLPALDRETAIQAAVRAAKLRITRAERQLEEARAIAAAVEALS